MNKVGFIYHPQFLKHDTGLGHPERPQRLSSLMKFLLGKPLWNSLVHLQPEPAHTQTIKLVHSDEYVRSIEQRCLSGELALDDGDTHVCKESFAIALLAAGAVMQGVDQVMRGDLESVFCAVRPPGHHAETARAMGFCLLNNVAIGARYAQKHYGVKRVAILDWDVHHGNGTQEIFWTDPSVLYISLHQYPYYPGTGAVSEKGFGLGEGFTVNCPMKAGNGESEYINAFETTILAALDRFKPELMMISAGFDAHEDDPLAGIRLTDASFGKMTAIVMEAASKYCGRRVVSVLEGGYDEQALARSVEVHLRELLS